MKIKVLGSYGSRLPGFHTSSLLIDDRLLVDAGTVTAILDLEEQATIDDVLLTHAHLDHMVDLAFLVDNVLTRRTHPLRIWAPAAVLDSLHRNLFNDEVWPDFTRIPQPDRPVLRFCPLPDEGRTRVAGIEVEWRWTRHPVPTAGYLLRADGAAMLFSGDTATTDAVWRLGRECPELKLAFVETSFPDRLRGLAEASGHLTPAMLATELSKLDRPDVPVLVFHVKPQFLGEVESELKELGDDRISLLEGGEIFEIADRARAVR
ncbi:beta-lactamase family protein [Geothermobacter ehrlichii]|uniref:Beta-lactamase family protein n=1 Tax=Geothermobacter ehrlichii TaxID=213224 RepID=A0A5D3WGU8_9BACT|nr:3',5'-cyclic-nucleotide phosphodiesterase [Geothermobacter ehrlichii]TYO95693.1 beta-lactamase family protein [Geothermobacter ehrlichii]